jgi:methylmalonyl-CoA mutase N-terminal domain/subunit
MAELRQSRNKEAVDANLKKISDVAANGGNIMPALIEAAENYVTLGEMVDELKQQFGIYEESVVF